MHKRCFLVFFSILALFILLAYALSTFIILPPFEALEQRELLTNLDRCQAALTADTKELLRQTGDWAEWDDTYKFIQSGNRDFINDNLGWDYLKNELTLDSLFIINGSKQVVWGEAIAEGKNAPTSTTALGHFLTRDEIFQPAYSGEPVAGLMPLAGDLWLLAARGVTSNPGGGQPNGILVMGKSLSPEYFELLSQRTRINCAISALPLQTVSERSAEQFTPLTSTDWQMIEQDKLRAGREINDLLDSPAAVISLEMPRDIYRQGRKAALAGGVSLSLVGLLVALLSTLLINRHLRLKNLKTELDESLQTKTEALLAYERSETEREALDLKLRQKYKMEAIGTMAGGIAHDFNNILAIIIGNANLMQGKLPADSSCRRNLDNLLIATTRAGDLVKQILTYSRLKKPLLHPCDLTAIVNESLGLLRSTTSTAIQIDVDLQSNAPIWINADATQIQQILINLCSNAIQAMTGQDMAGQGTLGLTLKERDIKAGDLAVPHQRLSGRFAHLSIRDTGPGMSAELIGKIFDPFFTTKGPSKGSGMGLSVVQGIVNNHNGIIDVESVEGKGSTFHLYFQLGSPIVSREATAQQPSPQGKERILFVDDEEMLVSTSVEILEDLGYRVTPANRSPQALECFKKDPNHFDLVITDMTMPELSGLELAKEIRKLNPRIPIILCSGYYNGSSQEEKASQDINAFCSKPLDARQLALTIRRVLDATPDRTRAD